MMTWRRTCAEDREGDCCWCELILVGWMGERWKRRWKMMTDWIVFWMDEYY